MEYRYYIKKRGPGEPSISIIEIQDEKPGEYITIHFGKHKQVNIKTSEEAESES